MKPVGPVDLITDEIRRQLSCALSDAALSLWQQEYSGVDHCFDASPAIEIACYRLAEALGRRDLFGFVFAEFEGDLPDCMLAPAINGGLRSVSETLRHWCDLLPDVWDRSFIEIYDLMEDLLDQRLSLHAASRLFAEMLPASIEPQSYSDDQLRVRGQLVVFNSYLEDMDRLIDENQELISVLAETNWIESMTHSLPPEAWKPRPWWLNDELIEVYNQKMELEIEEAQEMQPWIAQLTFSPMPKVERKGRTSTDERSVEYSELSLSAQGATSEWQSAAEFNGTTPAEDYTFRLLFEQQLEFPSYEEVQSAIELNWSSAIGIELVVKPNAVEIDTSERIYRVRFGLECVDILVCWDSKQSQFVGPQDHPSSDLNNHNSKIEGARIDLEKGTVFLRRRK